MHAEYTTNDWYEFLKDMITNVALGEKPGVFLFSD